jgi:hypothetical protein
MWVNLNEFKKQFFTHTLPENVKNVLDSIPIQIGECRWTDDPIVWKSKEEHRQAVILRIANSKDTYEDEEEEEEDDLPADLRARLNAILEQSD